MNSYERKDCRFCGATDLIPYLDLGNQPPSNSFLKESEIKREEKFPLVIALCPHCSLSQLTVVVSANDIFDDYQYLSSTSRALIEHYSSLVKTVTPKLGIHSNSTVLDIGCNDGIILDQFVNTAKKRIGVEPSNVFRIAKEKGHIVYNCFFSKESAQKIKSECGPVDLITATNVFAHIDDIHSVVQGVENLLKTDGVFIIETPYIVDMLEKNYFDTIYHEHLSYLGLSSLSYLMDQHGLEVFDVERVEIGASGPAIRVFSKRKVSTREVSPAVQRMLSQENAFGVKSIEPYRSFGSRVLSIKNSLRQILLELRKNNLKIGAYGAPAKGNTLLNTFELGPDIITEGVAETNPIKQGKLTPGSHLQIVSEEEFLKRRPPYALLLTWNYLDFFLKKSAYIAEGGKFILPLPIPKIIG